MVGPNHKQSRLYYFMITSEIEAFVVSSDKGISYRSDHSLVLINLRFSSQIRGGTWTFNNRLLGETEFIEKVKGEIKTVIEEYESDTSMDIETEDKQFNISYHLLWDMIKMKVRGSAISFSSFQKKEGHKKEKIYYIRYIVSLLDEKLLENNLPSVYQEREGIELELKILREKIDGISLGDNVKDGTGNIWPSFVACTGYERTLAECSHRSLDRKYCRGHTNDVGIKCLNSDD
ncbi:Hypothetical predicted protein, partial [Mytilus galloprovincialis]